MTLVISVFFKVKPLIFLKVQRIFLGRLQKYLDIFRIFWTKTLKSERKFALRSLNSENFRLRRAIFDLFKKIGSKRLFLMKIRARRARIFFGTIFFRLSKNE